MMLSMVSLSLQFTVPFICSYPFDRFHISIEIMCLPLECVFIGCVNVNSSVCCCYPYTYLSPWKKFCQIEFRTFFRVFPPHCPLD